ncbi:MAG TPA: amidase [Stellaceae bacterium]|jgi:aspartyl-tRNA(Asn)/glutamyl-tRNA(Gln) amidotransferase subunit A|nr:amidase [Stellaceae bacterium]
MPQDLHYLTIAEMAGLIAGKKLSPVELTEALLARIASLDPQLNAYLMVTADKAMAQARKAEGEIAAGNYRGPLHGVPFGLKDIYATAGIRTTGHSKVCVDAIPTADATTVEKLYAAGAILTGKLATHEFAHGGPSFDLPWPPARNPWNTAHFTGGSSSGSGAAIAAGLVPAALGSDTGGSIRGPAAYCGIVGLKPTYGLVSRWGVHANSFTFDHAGPMSWSVEDCAILLQAIAGHDPKDPASANVALPYYRAALTGNIKGLRIGVLRHLHEDECAAAPETLAALDEAYNVFRALGATLEDAHIPPAQLHYDVKVTIAESELFAIHEQVLRTRPGDFGADFLGRVLPAVLFGGNDYVQAQRERRRILAEMAPVYAKFDLLLTASAGGPAPKLDNWRTISFWQHASLTTPFNVTGGPALSQCMGFSGSGLPLSLQLVGRPFDEVTVLRAAHAYEKATGWRSRRPVLDPTVTAPPAVPASAPPPRVKADAATRDLVIGAIRRAGLPLNEAQTDMVLAAAPFVTAMVARLRRERDYTEEPANTFNLAAGSRE